MPNTLTTLLKLSEVEDAFGILRWMVPSHTVSFRSGTPAGYEFYTAETSWLSRTEATRKTAEVLA